MKRAFLLVAVLLGGCEAEQKQEDFELKEPDPKSSLETFGVSATTKNMFKRQGLARLQDRLNGRLAAVQKKLDDELPDAGGSAPKNEPPEELEINGTLDAPTQRALGAFQKTEGMPETGMPDYKTLKRLGFKPSDIFQHRPPSNRNRRDEKS